MKTAPLLSIGMIFKNEARCLERCMQSLQPLRDAIPCELIMADTGATDGSREIAERYADEVFDFAWINDFAAARNAVMDRCSGKWYLSIDCDEWLDTDIAELTGFLLRKGKTDFAFVIVRDYLSAELEVGESYSDFHAMRLMQMSTGLRYSGAIHESWHYREPAERLNHTILHHDGYFFVDADAKKKKTQRNMKLLRESLKVKPEDLRTLNHCIESGSGDAEFIQYIHRAVKLVQEKRGQWELYGPVILSHAVEVARVREMPELKEWITFAEKQFSNSCFVKVSINRAAFMEAYKEKDWEKAIQYGESYRKGLCEFRSARQASKNEIDLRTGSPRSSDAVTERALLTGLANAYLQNKQGEKALQILENLDGRKLEPGQVRNVVIALSQLHAQTQLNISPALTAFYEQIDQMEPNEQSRNARLAAFNVIAGAAFAKKYREEEKEHHGYWRPAYTVFRVLADKCEAGRAAALMMATDPEEIHTWLARVEDWQALPIEALEYALQESVAFPLDENSISVEVLDSLAAKLTREENLARQMVLTLADDAEYQNLQSLFWVRSLSIAALRSFDWSLGKNSAPVSKFACLEKKEESDKRLEDTPEIGLALIHRFVQIESTVLPLLYTPQMLVEENTALLPPMHRWGLYCSLAFEALDEGKPQEYLALLRKGLKVCPSEKDMVQFLLDRFMEDARPKASAELLALAEKVKAILAMYDADDPAVAVIRKSPAYKQIAWLIEDTPDLPVQ